MAMLFIIGCASRTVTVSTPKPGSGAEEYRQLASESSAAVLRSLRSLELVSAQSHQCPPKIVTGFAQEVERLQVDSLRVRARAQAIRARADAYFESWAGKTNLMNGAQAGQEPDYFPQIRESFGRIKLASDATRESFRPFLAGLRELQVELEADPGVIETEHTKELIRTTREQGRDVLKNLGVLSDELQALRPALAKLKAENL